MWSSQVTRGLEAPPAAPFLLGCWADTENIGGLQPVPSNVQVRGLVRSCIFPSFLIVKAKAKPLCPSCPYQDERHAGQGTWSEQKMPAWGKPDISGWLLQRLLQNWDSSCLDVRFVPLDLCRLLQLRGTDLVKTDTRSHERPACSDEHAHVRGVGTGAREGSGGMGMDCPISPHSCSSAHRSTHIPTKSDISAHMYAHVVVYVRSVTCRACPGCSSVCPGCPGLPWSAYPPGVSRDAPGCPICDPGVVNERSQGGSESHLKSIINTVTCITHPLRAQ